MTEKLTLLSAAGLYANEQNMARIRGGRSKAVEDPTWENVKPIFDKLLYRHWDEWVEGKRQHLFVVPVNADGTAGEPRDVTPGENDAVPTPAMRAGVSVGIDDLVVPETKGKLLKKATDEVRAIEKEAYEGRLDSSTRYNKILQVWVN